MRDIAAKQQRQVQMKRDLSRIPPGYDPARHAEVHRRGRSADSAGSGGRAIPGDARARAAAQARADAHRAGSHARSVALGTLRTRRAQISFTEKDFNELRAEYDRVRGELQESKVAAARAQEQVSGATAALAAAQESAEELKKKVAELEVLQTDRRLHDELDRAYTDLRTDLNFQLRPELSELASAFLSELTDARYTELELDDSTTSSCSRTACRSR